MLVLSRRLNEAIVINGNIRVSVVNIDGGKVRIGIEAPADIPIHRQEVLDRIEADKKTEGDHQ